MSDTHNLPTFEEITQPSVSDLFAPPAEGETDKPFLDALFVPPQPETYGRITPVAAPVKPPTDKCRTVYDPARKWLREISNQDPELWERVHAEIDPLTNRSDKIKALHKAYASYQMEQERAALNERLSVVKSWRG